MAQLARLAWLDGPDVDPRPGGPTLLAKVVRHAGPVAQTVRPGWLGWHDQLFRPTVSAGPLRCHARLARLSRPTGAGVPACWTI
jgi:hypothetical protein